jgi:ribonucleoside-diphosphate reductase alpha chain
MSMAFDIEARRLADIPLQDASLDIWDTKYRLKTKSGDALDRDIQGTYERVARALAEVEDADVRDYWYERFVWALQRGAIPAGRIISNAGAGAHKPATSTINCTVSGTIKDSMHHILERVHEAGLTLKAGCVAPGTWVYTDRGLVTADRAVEEGHASILCYDRDAQRFEMRRIERHMTTHVPREENIEIESNGATLTTSIKHPVLVYRNDDLIYVRADEVAEHDALVHHAFPWTAAEERAPEAWFAGAHLGDGSAYAKRVDYKPTRRAWAERAQALGQRLVFKIRAAEREVVERYAEFFAAFCGARARVTTARTVNGTEVWDYCIASFKASNAASLIDHQTGSKSGRTRVPRWIAEHPEQHFLPFLAGLIDTDGTVARESGSASIATSSIVFAEELKALLGLFGVHASLTLIKPRRHWYRGHIVKGKGGAVLKISDSVFLAAVARYMADSGKRQRIAACGTQSGQYDRYVLPERLRGALEEEAHDLGHAERQKLGFYHGYHRKHCVSRIWLDR